MPIFVLILKLTVLYNHKIYHRNSCFPRNQCVLVHITLDLLAPLSITTALPVETDE